MVYFQLIIDFGFILSGTEKCAIFRGNKDKLSVITISIVQGKILLSLIGLGIVSFMVLSLDIFNGKELFTFLAYIPICLATFIPDFLFRGIERMSIITYRSIVSNIIYTVLLFALIKQPTDYLLIPVINFLSIMVVIVWSWYFLVKRVGIRIRLASLTSTVCALKESSGFFLSRIATATYNSSNVLVLGLCGFSNVAVGTFGVANNLTNMLRSMFSPIADSIYPYMMKNKNYKLVKNIIIIGMPVVLIGVIGLYIYADLIIRILSGNEYLAAVPIFKAMLPLVLITLPTYLLGFPVLGAMGKAKEANISVLYGSGFHVIGLLALYITGTLTFIPVVILTCFTELTILCLRIIYIAKARREITKKRGEII
jgi:PST family polysaccharide transporter